MLQHVAVPRRLAGMGNSNSNSIRETTGFGGPAIAFFASLAVVAAVLIAIDARLLLVLAGGMFLGAFGAVIAGIEA